MPISIDLLPVYPGDPFFALEPTAAKYTFRDPDVSALTDFDALIGAAVLASQISELAGVKGVCEEIRVAVVISNHIDCAGFCYASDEYALLEDVGIAALLVLNPMRAIPQLTLPELFLHELTHVFTGEFHGWDFLCVLNALRWRCGLSPSTDPYDVRDGFMHVELPEAISSDLALVQQWCAKVGAGLAKQPDFNCSFRGALREVESMFNSLGLELTPDSFMSFADDVCRMLQQP